MNSRRNAVTSEITAALFGCVLSLGALSSSYASTVAQRGARTPDPSAVTPSSQKQKKRRTRSKHPQTLQAVQVTAMRRVQSLQRVPAAVSVIGQNDIENLNLTDMRGFAALVPGLSLQQSNSANGNTITIRGVTTGSQQESQTVGVYLDGVPIGGSTSNDFGFTQVPISLFDVQQVSVLKGPQGTLYGGNSMGGAIKYSLAPPNLDRTELMSLSQVSQTQEAGAGFDEDIMVNQPFDSGKAAIRVDGEQRYDPGYMSNPSLNLTNVGARHLTSGRAQLLFQPTSNFNAQVLALYDNSRSNGDNIAFYNNVTDRPLLGQFNQFTRHPTPSSNALRLFTVKLNWVMPWATFTSISGYQKDTAKLNVDTSPIYDALLSGATGAPVNDSFVWFVNYRTKKLTQEFRLTSPSNQPIEWIAGAFWTHESSRQFDPAMDTTTGSADLDGSPINSVFAPSSFNEMALYGDATWHATNKLSVTAGVRDSFDSQLQRDVDGGWIDFPGAPNGTHDVVARSVQNTKTWLGDVSYQVTPDFMVYGKVSSGYRPGGPNPPIANAPQRSFVPDSVWNYEAGEKAMLFHHHLIVNSSVYQVNWRNIQFTALQGISQFVNAGAARIRGASIDIKAKEHQWQVAATAGYIDATFQSSSIQPLLLENARGKRLPGSPRLKGAVSIGYGFNLWGNTPALAFLTDEWVGNRTMGVEGSPVSPFHRLPGYNSLNFDLNVFASRRVEVNVFAHNMLNRIGQVSTTFAGDLAVEVNPTLPYQVVLTPPRTVGVSVRVSLGHRD